MPKAKVLYENDAKIENSEALSLSFHDQSYNHLNMKTQNGQYFEFYIPRDLDNRKLAQYSIISSSNLNYSSSNFLYTRGFYMNTSNSSVHIRIKTNQTKIGFLFALKFGRNPVLNSSIASYDIINKFCSNSGTYFFNLVNS